MRKKKKSDEGGFNVWRSYSDMMAVCGISSSFSQGYLCLWPVWVQ